MSVVKHLQKLSDMEYYKVAVALRREITLWLLRDFGLNHSCKSLKMVLKDATPEETASVNAVFEAHGKSLNKQFRNEYPEWFIKAERKFLIKCSCKIIKNIVSANSIFPTSDAELELRRNLQDKAIANCYAIFQEIAFIKDFFKGDLNYLTKLLETLQREIHLLKGWRQGDNKYRKQLKSN